VKTYFVRNRRININSFGTEKSQNSKHNFLGMSETSKNEVFQARRRRKIFEIPDFLSFAPPFVFCPPPCYLVQNNKGGAKDKIDIKIKIRVPPCFAGRRPGKF